MFQVLLYLGRVPKNHEIGIYFLKKNGIIYGEKKESVVIYECII